MAGLVWLVGSIRYDVLSMASLLLITSVFSAYICIKTPNKFVFDWQSLALKNAWCLIPWAIALVLSIGIIGSYAPPSDHDTLRYQLYLPDSNLVLGQITTQFGRSIYEFLPPLGSMYTHMAYALGGAVGASLLNICWQVVAAVAAATITFRLSRRLDIAWLAALFLLSQRVSINLASAVSMEFILAAYAGAAFITTIALLHKPNISMGLTLGLIVGGLLNVKHHGLVYAACLYAPLFFMVARRKINWSPVFVSGTVAFATLLPWLGRNWIQTGNPVFPTFNHLFSPNNAHLYDEVLALNRIGTDFWSFIQLPWTLFVNQNQFDGLQFGLPILLLFIPFAFLDKSRHHLLFMLAIIFTYLSIWFSIMPHLIRFLAPLFPILCAFAALGAGTVADATKDFKLLRRITLILVIGVGVAQSGFLAATGTRRIPAAFNIISPLKFLQLKPFIWYSQYNACHWVSERLTEDEAYLTLLNDPSFYCSIARSFPDFLPGDGETIYSKSPRPKTPPQWLGSQILNCKVKYVIVARNIGTDTLPYVFSKHRYDALYKSVAGQLTPIHTTPVAFVYSGEQMAHALLELSPVQSSYPVFQQDIGQKCAVDIAGI